MGPAPGLDAELDGNGLKYGPGKRQDAFVMDWKSTDQSIHWPVRITTPGDFELAVTYDADPQAVGGSYRVSLGGNGEAKGEVEGGKEHSQTLGRVRLNPGAFDLRIQPTDVRNGQFLKLRNLSLTPVAQ